MKYKISELAGEALNQAVANANEEDAGVIFYADYCGTWEYGGPIIQREHISIEYYKAYWWAVMPKYQSDCEMPDLSTAKPPRMGSGYRQILVLGSTPLEAAMRAFVLAKVGNEVELNFG